MFAKPNAEFRVTLANPLIRKGAILRNDYKSLIKEFRPEFALGYWKSSVDLAIGECLVSVTSVSVKREAPITLLRGINISISATCRDMNVMRWENVCHWY